MKYGVMSRDALLHDLRTWSYLYVAGRMHKPVRDDDDGCDDTRSYR